MMATRDRRDLLEFTAGIHRIHALARCPQIPRNAGIGRSPLCGTLSSSSAFPRNAGIDHPLLCATCPVRLRFPAMRGTVWSVQPVIRSIPAVRGLCRRRRCRSVAAPVGVPVVVVILGIQLEDEPTDLSHLAVRAFPARLNVPPDARGGALEAGARLSRRSLQLGGDEPRVNSTPPQRQPTGARERIPH